MEITKLSSKGQVIIPKDVRSRRSWKPGQVFDIVETQEGVLLRPHSPFPPSDLASIGEHLKYEGPKIPMERLSIAGMSYRDPYDEENDECS